MYTGSHISLYSPWYPSPFFLHSHTYVSTIPLLFDHLISVHPFNMAALISCGAFCLFFPFLSFAIVHR